MIRSVLAPLDLLVQVLLRDASEWERSSEHDIEEDAKGPHVDRLAIVFVLAYDFWTHVAWGSAENLQALVVSNDHAETEVYQLDHACALLDQDVIKLDVAMDDVVRVEIADRLGHLLKDAPRGRLPNDPIR